MSATIARRVIGVVIFDGFELLDVFGPVEVFGSLPEHFSITVIGPQCGSVESAQGPSVDADVSYEDAPVPNIVLVPGGKGSRKLISDRQFIAWLAGWASPAEYVTSICTGSGLLAAAGLLDGYRATSNKRSFAWARAQSSKVDWIPEARWVEDRNRWTSSG